MYTLCFNYCAISTINIILELENSKKKKKKINTKRYIRIIDRKNHKTCIFFHNKIIIIYSYFLLSLSFLSHCICAPSIKLAIFITLYIIIPNSVYIYVNLYSNNYL